MKTNLTRRSVTKGSLATLVAGSTWGATALASRNTEISRMVDKCRSNHCAMVKAIETHKQAELVFNDAERNVQRMYPVGLRGDALLLSAEELVEKMDLGADIPEEITWEESVFWDGCLKRLREELEKNQDTAQTTQRIWTEARAADATYDLIKKTINERYWRAQAMFQCDLILYGTPDEVERSKSVCMAVLDEFHRRELEYRKPYRVDELRQIAVEAVEAWDSALFSLLELPDHTNETISAKREMLKLAFNHHPMESHEAEFKVRLNSAHLAALGCCSESIG